MPTSSHEIAQILQAIVAGKTYTYNFELAAEDTAEYGQPAPILYNVSRINSNTLSFWYGDSDTQVSPTNIERNIADLTGEFSDIETLLIYTMDLTNPSNSSFSSHNKTVPVVRHRFSSPVFFNHFSFFFHQNTSILVIIPAMQTIESS